MTITHTQDGDTLVIEGKTPLESTIELCKRRGVMHPSELKSQDIRSKFTLQESENWTNKDYYYQL